MWPKRRRQLTKGRAIMWQFCCLAAICSFYACTTVMTQSVKQPYLLSAELDQISYRPAQVEQYLVNNTKEFGWDSKRNPDGCMIWTDAANPMHHEFQTFLSELETYQQRVANFEPIPMDIREWKLEKGRNACSGLDLQLDQLFPSGQLSFTPQGGCIEPLTTPMRHPYFCTKGREALMDMNYMVHDFAHMCRQLYPNARTVLIDMGASLSYHNSDQTNALLHSDISPIEYLMDLYERFGFHFDHIYGYEQTFTEPEIVFSKLLPPKHHTAYHWINAGVRAELDHPLNPLQTIVRKFSTDDFLVVKLDIDTADIEVPLAQQLLNDPDLTSRVDQFYFEHHVHMKEMARIWRSGMAGTLQETFALFQGLRKAGVPAHFWV